MRVVRCRATVLYYVRPFLPKTLLALMGQNNPPRPDGRDRRGSQDAQTGLTFAETLSGSACLLRTLDRRD